MLVPPHVLLWIAIIAEVVGTTAMKAAEGFTRPGPSLVAVIGYAVSFYFLAQVLDRIPIGIAYAIWSGAGMVLIGLAGWAIYGQRLDLAGLVGIALIIAGVLVLNLLSKTTMH